MRTWSYPVVLEDCGGGEWLARFPDVPEALTSGSGREAALASAADALDEALLAYMAAGRRAPTPSIASGSEVSVDLEPVTAARLALADAMAEEKVTNVGLARRLNRSEGAVRRLVDGHTGVKMETVVEALRALGRRATLVSG